MTERRWATVFEGTPTQGIFLRGMLEGEGIECVVPDELTKLADPFITGANPLQMRLQVSEADLDRAQALLSSARLTPEAGPGTDGGDASPSEEADDESAGADAAQDPWVAAGERIVDRAALRTILLCALIVTAPLALFAFVAYLRACARRKTRSRLHTGAWLAFGLSVALVAAVVIEVATPEPAPRHGWPSMPPPRPPPVKPFGFR